MSDTILFVLCGATLLASLVTLILTIAGKKDGGSAYQLRQLEAALRELRGEVNDELRAGRLETSHAIQESVNNMGQLLARAQGQAAQVQDTRLAELNRQLTQRQETLQKTVSDSLLKLDGRFADFGVQTELRLDGVRATVENRLTSLQEDNAKKLDQMRATVDEKLEKTLQERLGQSFRLVSERLEQVYKGLGEMQSLATGVGDLKKVLSNVKTRGVLGEIQLGAILEQILSPEQYERNVATKPGSGTVVEYAVKLPGDDSGSVWLPVDAKFPADAYAQLTEAYDSGDAAKVSAAGAVLERRIRAFARDIRDKYIDPPHTTEFGVMFLPFEGLYAEVVRRGLLEALQREYKVTVAGPTTMAALLNSLQMGFRTLAIQKRSGEVWQVLGAVKTEFDKFGTVLQATQQRLEQAGSELDKLIGVRTRQIQRRLQSVASLPAEESSLLTDEAPPADGDAGLPQDEAGG